MRTLTSLTSPTLARCVRAGIECPSRMRCGRTPYATRLDPERPHGTISVRTMRGPGPSQDRPFGIATQEVAQRLAIPIPARHGVRPGAPFATTTSRLRSAASRTTPRCLLGPIRDRVRRCSCHRRPSHPTRSRTRRGVAKILDNGGRRSRRPPSSSSTVGPSSAAARQCRLP